MLVLSTFFASAYNYETISSWSDICNDQSYQQSPVRLSTLNAVGGGGFLTIQTNNTKFDYGNATVEIDTGDRHAVSQIHYAADADSSDVQIFYFERARLHLGAAEHIVDSRSTGGCFHFEHKDRSGNLAVIELPFIFGDLPTTYPISVPTKCDDNVSNIDSEFCNATDSNHVEVGGLVYGEKHSNGMNLYESLGFPRGFAPEDFITYVGSMTIPDCARGVEWFVWAGEPPIISRIEGYESLERAIRNGIDFRIDLQYGNVRGIQTLRRPAQWLDGLATDACMEAIAMASFTTMIMMTFM
eukprot:GHVH01007976.1.p1 GENE.GHVH01007976.1~~GHVH01007976.1.p1  ORF type:complete len:299 (+),score=38.68 GHVH01007976.1:80-976(+)